MPNKGHRAASRQAQVRRKRRRTKGRTQEFDPGPTQSRAATVVEELVVEAEPEPEAVVERPTPPGPGPVRRARQRVAAEPASVHRFLGRELRQIGMITALIFAILVVLTVFLRS